jgi:hypothetical protein
MSQQFYIKGRWVGVDEMKRKRDEKKKKEVSVIEEVELPKRKGRPPKVKV